jgi:hypothetical protein
MAPLHSLIDSALRAWAEGRKSLNDVTLDVAAFISHARSEDSEDDELTTCVKVLVDNGAPLPLLTTALTVIPHKSSRGAVLLVQQAIFLSVRSGGVVADAMRKQVPPWVVVTSKDLPVETRVKHKTGRLGTVVAEGLTPTTVWVKFDSGSEKEWIGVIDLTKLIEVDDSKFESLLDD